ncbi:MAG TPA: hypothetical protein VJR89_30365, partial [Polyangiales bacterium]|nr:hypothetical protein [Polyangiales bacterium]
GVLLCAVLGLGACLVDEDQPCGDEFVELSGIYGGCVCPRGSVLDAQGKRCKKCGAHEKAQNDVCVCDEGYERPSGGGACALIQDSGSADASDTPDGPPSGEGESCETSADCASYAATFCQNLQAPFVCLVQGCATGQRSCSGSYVCCSFPDIPPLAGANGLCIPESNCAPFGKVVK